MAMLPLSPELFARLDESPDDLFYESPRFVTHIDDRAIAAVTQLYREYLPPGGAILDLMSSWISHLPPEIAYREVVLLGMNREELAANPRATGWLVHDLNREPRLPFDVCRSPARKEIQPPDLTGNLLCCRQLNLPHLLDVWRLG